jgi:hypothetical protein
MKGAFVGEKNFDVIKMQGTTIEKKRKKSVRKEMVRRTFAPKRK